MDDMEKGRVTHVTQMEQAVEHLRGEYEHFRAIAEKWQPVFTTEIDASSKVTRFGLTFGGKHATAKVSQAFLQEMDVTGATTQILEVLIKSLVTEQLTPELRPLIERAHQGAMAVKLAGKW